VLGNRGLLRITQYAARIFRETRYVVEVTRSESGHRNRRDDADDHEHEDEFDQREAGTMRMERSGSQVAPLPARCRPLPVGGRAISNR